MTLFVVSFYLLDCLYAERKDRSILFWKSLAGVRRPDRAARSCWWRWWWCRSGCSRSRCLRPGVLRDRGRARRRRQHPVDHRPGTRCEWLRTELAMLLILLLAVLWYAPLAAYLMVVSAWARRRPFLWATLPWVLAPILERIAFGTHYLWSFLRYRSNGIFATLVAGHTHIFSRHARLAPRGDAARRPRFPRRVFRHRPVAGARRRRGALCTRRPASAATATTPEPHAARDCLRGGRGSLRPAMDRAYHRDAERRLAVRRARMFNARA